MVALVRMAVVARPSLNSDITAVQQLIVAQYQQQLDVRAMLETSLLCLTAVDRAGQVVGFLSLLDSPINRVGGSSDQASAWLSTSVPPRAIVSSSAFMQLAVSVEDFEVEASHALLKAALTIIPSLQRLFMATVTDLTFTEPGLGSLFTRVGGSKEAGVHLYEAERSAVLPPLTLRSARVQDHDDLLPVLNDALERYPALAKLPESSKPEEPFALTRLVAGQDERNHVFVAEADGKLVGFMVATADVNTAGLLDVFDLHPYDNFLPEDIYQKQYNAAQAAVHERKLSALRQQRTLSMASKRQFADALAGNLTEQDASVQTENAAAGFGDLSVDNRSHGSAVSGEALDPSDAELEAAAQPLEEEVREEMALMFVEAHDVEPAVFAITMLCLQQGYEAQSVELLQHAFEAFPSKPYCVVTLPNEAEEPPLLQLMARIAPITGALFPEVLYLFNRHGLHMDVNVRLASTADASGVSSLLEGMASQSEFSESFSQALTRHCAVVATCQGEVVGMCTINPQVDLGLLRSNFDLPQVIDLQQHAPEKHAEIDMYCVNPIFSPWHRVILCAVQKLTGRCVLHYALPPSQQPPDMLDVLIQAPPRHILSTDSSSSSDFALYTFTRRGAFVRRRVCNSQIVVVGASEAGLSVMETLLLQPTLHFTHLSLLAPGGVSVPGLARSYTESLLAKLGLDARVSLLDAEMVGLDRGNKTLELSDGTSLSYDLLVIAAGLQDQTLNEFGALEPAAAGAMLNDGDLAANFTVGDANIMTSITVYGHTLAAYSALATLQAKGAADKSYFRAPEHALEDPYVRILSQVADFTNLILPQPVKGTLASLTCMEDDPRVIANFSHEDGTQGDEAVTNLLVGCTPRRISLPLFQCLNGSSLVFDGRLVVDAAFRTNDPCIYGAGTIAQLSRRYGPPKCYEHHNSLEVGRLVASSLVSTLHGGAGAQEPPVTKRARVVASAIPGGVTFAYAGVHAAIAEPSLDEPEGGRALITQTERAYWRLNLDAAGKVYSIIYIGRLPIQPSRLEAITGLHTSYLNDIVNAYDANGIVDFGVFLTEDWSQGFYHDQWSTFHASLLADARKQIYSSGVASGLPRTDELDETAAEQDLMEALVAMAQERLLEFVQERAGELQTYKVPPLVQAALVA